MKNIIFILIIVLIPLQSIGQSTRADKVVEQNGEYLFLKIIPEEERRNENFLIEYGIVHRIPVGNLNNIMHIEELLLKSHNSGKRVKCYDRKNKAVGACAYQVKVTKLNKNEISAKEAPYIFPIPPETTRPNWFLLTMFAIAIAIMGWLMYITINYSTNIKEFFKDFAEDFEDVIWWYLAIPVGLTAWMTIWDSTVIGFVNDWFSNWREAIVTLLTLEIPAALMLLLLIPGWIINAKDKKK